MKQYKFFSYEPNGSFDFPYTLDIDFWDSVSIFEGDYLHEDFGFLENDSRNVLSHASGLIHLLLDDKDNNELKMDLLRDFGNYLVCMESFQGNRGDALQIILALITFGLIDYVSVDILHYYIRCKKNLQEGNGPSRDRCLDFETLYIAIGDKVLIENLDLDLALRYYYLAQLEWPIDFFFPSIDEEEIDPLSGFSNQMTKTWEEKYDCLDELRRGHYNVNLDKFDAGDKDELRLRFEKCLSLAKAYDENAIEEIDAFIDFLGKDFHAVTDRERLGLVMLGSLRKLCVPNMFYFLSNENESLIDDFSNEILSFIRDYDYNSNHRLWAWINDTEVDNPHRIVLEFYRANYYVEKIEDLLRSQSPNSNSAYYTSYETFSLMLPDHCIDARDDECGKFSVMNIAYMNDPNEGIVVRKRLFGEDGIPSIESERHVLEAPYVFLKCFTSLIDYLPMWQMYGDSAQGVCIVVDWDSSSDTSLYRVCYLHKTKTGYTIRESDNKGLNTKEIDEALKSLKSICVKFKSNEERLVFDSFLSPIVYLFKDSSYSYEQELRIMYQYKRSNRNIRHTNQNPPKLYVVNQRPLNIKELILGPRFKDVTNTLPYLSEQIELMTDKTHTIPPKITISNIDFR